MSAARRPGYWLRQQSGYRLLRDPGGGQQSAMATRYQHVLDCIRKDVARQVGGLLWEPSADAADDEDDGTTAPPGRWSRSDETAN